MTRKALDPNLASILDSIRATVGADTPPPAPPEVDPDELFEDASGADAVPTDGDDVPAATPAKGKRKPAPALPSGARSVEDFLAELIRPQVEAWLNAHLPELVQKMAADEIARLTGKS